jgi:hypothetical protein
MAVRIALVLASLAAAIAMPARAGAGDDPLDALNRVIQARFAGIDKFFGLRRIVVIGDTPHQFRPETVSEEAVVQDLRDENLKVALYMAGRRVLDREPNLLSEKMAGVDRRVIFGPVAITAVERLDELPRSVDLIDEARNAFQQLQRRDRYPFEVAGVKFSARAVRANSDGCLACHEDSKQGDPLGVVIYAYQQSAIGNQQSGAAIRNRAF